MALDSDPAASGAQERRAIAGFHLMRRWENVRGTPFVLTVELAKLPLDNVLCVRLGLTFVRELERRSLPHRLMLECDHWTRRPRSKLGDWTRSRLVWLRPERSFHVSSWGAGSTLRPGNATALLLTVWPEENSVSPTRGLYPPLAQLPRI